jgi:hypothetical protein
VTVRVFYVGGSHANDSQFNIELPEWPKEKEEINEEKEEEEDNYNNNNDDDLSGNRSAGFGSGDRGSSIPIAV